MARDCVVTIPRPPANLLMTPVAAIRAAVAVAASMLTAAYFMLRDGVEYHHHLGPQPLAQRDQEQVAKRLLQRLRDLGINVEVTAA